MMELGEDRLVIELLAREERIRGEGAVAALFPAYIQEVWLLEEEGAVVLACEAVGKGGRVLRCRGEEGGRNRVNGGRAW